VTGTLARLGRLTVALGGGYAFAAGLIALTGAGLPHMGLIASEAVTLGAMLGLIAYIAVIVWAVGTSRPVRTAAIVVVSATAMILSAPLLA
jgi:hypothetical protein